MKPIKIFHALPKKPEIELAERVIAHCDDYRYLANDIADIKDLAAKVLENAKEQAEAPRKSEPISPQFIGFLDDVYDLMERMRAK